MTRDVGDTNLISTTDAAAFSGYSKDYIGQLCREGKVECRRVSGQWQIDKDALEAYKAGERDAEARQHDDDDAAGLTLYTSKTGNVRNDTFTYDGIEYISTGRAADLTGYAQDYVGQLARSGEVVARRVGRRWFVGRASLVAHKKENDDALAQVQAQSSGVTVAPIEKEQTHTPNLSDARDIHFNVRYIPESDAAPFAPLSGRASGQGKKVLPTSQEPSDAMDGIRSAPRPLQEQRKAPEHIESPKEAVSTRVPEAGIDGIVHRKGTQMPEKGLKYVSRIAEMEEVKQRPAQNTAPKRGRANGTTSYSIGALLVLGIILISIGGLIFFALTWHQGDLAALTEMRSLDDIRSYLTEQYGAYVPGSAVEYRATR